MNKTVINQYLLIFALVAISFFAGIFWANSQNVSKASVGANGSVANSTDTAQDASSNQGSEEKISSVAESLDLNMADFNACLLSNEAKTELAADKASGTSAGVQGTPGVFLVDTSTNKAVVVRGGVPLSVLEEDYSNLLSDTGTIASQVAGMNDNDSYYGEKNARVVLYTYSDFQCSHCANFHKTAGQFVDNHLGDVVWVPRQFAIFPGSDALAIAAKCAGKLGGNTAFFSFSDALFGY